MSSPLDRGEDPGGLRRVKIYRLTRLFLPNDGRISQSRNLLRESQTLAPSLAEGTRAVACLRNLTLRFVLLPGSSTSRLPVSRTGVARQ